jgi:hypothetical protein
MKGNLIRIIKNIEVNISDALRNPNTKTSVSRFCSHIEIERMFKKLAINLKKLGIVSKLDRSSLQIKLTNNSKIYFFCESQIKDGKQNGIYFDYFV